jgi:hypothetical protein
MSMGRLGRVSIAFLCSIVVMPIAFFLGFYLLLAVDPHYHDGVSLTGGLAIAGVASVVTFMGVMKKTQIQT